jgi:hypothetical protein
MFGVLSSVILYGLFKAVSRTVALTVLVLDVISNTISITASVLLFAPLIVLPGTYGMSAFSSEQLQALSLLSLRMYELAYAVNLGLFAGSCLLTGYLIYRSTFLPKFHAGRIRRRSVSVDPAAMRTGGRRPGIVVGDRRREFVKVVPGRGCAGAPGRGPAGVLKNFYSRRTFQIGA